MIRMSIVSGDVEDDDEEGDSGDVGDAGEDNIARRSPRKLGTSRQLLQNSVFWSQRAFTSHFHFHHFHFHLIAEGFQPFTFISQK